VVCCCCCCCYCCTFSYAIMYNKKFSWLNSTVRDMNEWHAPKSLIRNCNCSMCNVSCVAGPALNFGHLRTLAITSLVQKHLQIHFCNFFWWVSNCDEFSKNNSGICTVTSVFNTASADFKWLLVYRHWKVLNDWTHLTVIPFRSKSSLAGGGKHLFKLWIPWFLSHREDLVSLRTCQWVYVEMLDRRGAIR